MKEKKECGYCTFYSPSGFWCRLKNEGVENKRFCFWHVTNGSFADWLIKHWLKNWKFWISLAATLVLGLLSLGLIKGG